MREDVKRAARQSTGRIARDSRSRAIRLRVPNQGRPKGPAAI